MVTFHLLVMLRRVGPGFDSLGDRFLLGFVLRAKYVYASEALFEDTISSSIHRDHRYKNDSNGTSTDTGIRPPLHMTELATAVDGGHVAICIDSMPGQGLRIDPSNEELGTAPRISE